MGNWGYSLLLRVITPITTIVGAYVVVTTSPFCEPSCQVQVKSLRLKNASTTTRWAPTSYKSGCSASYRGYNPSCSCTRLFGCFLKWWYPTTMAFPTKMIILGCLGDHFGVFGGYHHLRKHPFIGVKTPFITGRGLPCTPPD